MRRREFIATLAASAFLPRTAIAQSVGCKADNAAQDGTNSAIAGAAARRKWADASHTFSFIFRLRAARTAFPSATRFFKRPFRIATFVGASLPSTARRSGAAFFGPVLGAFFSAVPTRCLSQSAYDLTSLKALVPQEGFEPPTPALRMRCSAS